MTHQHTLTIAIADTQIDVAVSFTRDPFHPGCGPSFSSGGDPPSGGEIEIESGEVIIGKERHVAPDWLISIIQEDDDLIEKLFDSVVEDDDGDRRYDQKRDEAA